MENNERMKEQYYRNLRAEEDAELARVSFDFPTLLKVCNPSNFYSYEAILTLMKLNNDDEWKKLMLAAEQ